jgi:hypothetical protein
MSHFKKSLDLTVNGGIVTDETKQRIPRPR